MREKTIVSVWFLRSWRYAVA